MTSTTLLLSGGRHWTAAKLPANDDDGVPTPSGTSFIRFEPLILGPPSQAEDERKISSAEEEREREETSPPPLPLVSCVAGNPEEVFIAEVNEEFGDGHRRQGWSLVQPLGLFRKEDDVLHNMRACFACLLPTDLLNAPRDDSLILLAARLRHEAPLKILDESEASDQFALPPSA